MFLNIFFHMNIVITTSYFTVFSFYDSMEVLLKLTLKKKKKKDHLETMTISIQFNLKQKPAISQS